MQYYNNDFDYSSGYYDGYSETEEERRRREKELADQAVQTQEITTYGDGTVEETTTREYAPAVQQMAVEPIQPVEPVQQMPVAQPVPQMQPVDPAALAQQQAAQVQQQPAAMAQPQAASPYDLTPTGTGVGFQPKFGYVSPPAGQAEQTKQYINNYQESQDNPMKLLALRGDETAPTFIRERAGEQAFELMNKEVQQKTAEKQAQQLAQAAAQGDRRASNTIARELQSKEGSWLKMILLKFIDPKLAGDEAVKLGVGNRWVNTTDSEGNAALVQVNLRGLPLKGYSADGNEIAAKDLVRYTSGGAAIKGVTQGQEVYKDPAGVVKGGFVLETRPGRMPRYLEVGTGRPATEEESRVLSKVGVAGTLEQQAAAQEQKQRINLFYEPAIAAASKGAATLAEFNAMNRTNFAIAGRDSLGMPLLVDQVSGQLLTKPPGTGTAGGTAAMPPATGGTATGVTADQARRLDTDIDSLNREIARIPANDPRRQERLNILNSELSKAQQARTQIGTVATGGTAAMPPAPGGQSPADIISQRGQQEAIRKQKLELEGKASSGVIKYIDETLVPAANDSQRGSDTIKRQLEIFSDPRSNALFGIYNKAESNSAGDKRWAMLRDIIGGRLDVKNSELSKTAAELGLTSSEISLLSEYNTLNGPLVAATARAIGGAQLSDADRSAAEKLQVDIGNTPALGAYNIKTQQLFAFDLARAKSDWAATQSFANTAQLESAWRKEQARLISGYQRVAEQRAQFIKVNSGDKPASVSMVRESFRRYPPPQYDPNSGWINLRDRKLNDILGR